MFIIMSLLQEIFLMAAINCSTYARDQKFDFWQFDHLRIDCVLIEFDDNNDFLCDMVEWWKHLTLFPAGTIVRDPYHCKSEFRLCWITLCSSDDHYTKAQYVFDWYI